MEAAEQTGPEFGSPEYIDIVTQPSEYDTSQISLYKKAIRLNVPVKYLLIKPTDKDQLFFIDSFNLDDIKDELIITLFSFIVEQFEQDPDMSILDLWTKISKFKGEFIKPSELVYILTKLIPKYAELTPTVIDEFNFFMSSTKEHIKFENQEDINSRIAVWENIYQTELHYDLETLTYYYVSQSRIAELQSVYHSPLYIDGVIVSYGYEAEKGINPLIDIFNSAKNSYIVPFVHLNLKSPSADEANNMKYYKIYKGKSIETRPNYSNIILTSSQTSKANTIYFNIYAEPEEEQYIMDENAKNSKKESFKMATINYNDVTNSLMVTINSPRIKDEVDETTIIQRLHDHVDHPLLQKPRQDQVKESKISGYFMMYKTDLEHNSLSYLIMNDPLFSSYLYLEESSSGFPFQQKYNIHYRGISLKPKELSNKNPSKIRTKSALSATLIQETLPNGEVFEFIDSEGKVQKTSLEEPISVIKVKINRANSKQIADQFIKILTKLFYVYLDATPDALETKGYRTGNDIIAEYREFVPGFDLLIQKSTEQELVQNLTPYQSKESQKIEILKKYAPDVFVKGYARNCQKPRQPVPVRNATEKAQLIASGRTVLDFPIGTNKYSLTCMSETFQYIGLVPNKNLPNKTDYPFIPCCFKDQGDAIARMREASGEVLSVATRKKSKQKQNYTLSSDKFLTSPNRSGYLRTELVNFLKNYSPESGEFLRIGAPTTTNSFIHCVLYALQDTNYLLANDPEAYAQSVRESLADSLHLVKQEMYDTSLEDIRAAIKNPEVFFDPLLFYRLIEEATGYNIYIFSLNNQQHDTNQKMSLLQLPRHKYFHSHPYNPGRGVILILRHYGSKSNDQSRANCELIVEKFPIDANKKTFDETRTKVIFDESMDKLLYPALSFVGRTLTWQISEVAKTENGYNYIDPEITTRMNVYSTLNYQLLFGDIPIAGQFIDGAGKTRMIYVIPEWQDKDHTSYSNLMIFINVPPTAPLNVPLFELEQVAPHLPEVDNIIKFLGTPTGLSISVDQTKVSGLWFAVGDIPFCLYCPSQYYDINAFKEKWGDIPVKTELSALTINIPREENIKDISSSKRIRYLQRAAKFVDQILKYLYLIAGKPEDINGFMDRVCEKLGNPKPDSLEIYNIGKIRRILPAGTLEEVLRKFSELGLNFFRAGRLIVYDDKMWSAMAYQLRQFRKLMMGLNIGPSQLRELQHYYENYYDFDFDSKYQYMLIGIKDFTDWTNIYVPSSNLQQRSIQNLKDNIQLTLNAGAFVYTEPYIYQQSGNNIIGSSYDPADDRFYLVQNVTGGDIAIAMNVAYNWYYNKINLGFGAPKYESPLIPTYVIYKISPGGGIVLQDDKSNGEENYLEILNYGNNVYAALLPL